MRFQHLVLPDGPHAAHCALRYTTSACHKHSQVGLRPRMDRCRLLASSVRRACACMRVPGRCPGQVLSAATDRLQDYDEKVRAAAAKHVCELVAGLDPGHEAFSGAMEAVAGRLRDRKIAVRKASLAGLLAVWRACCAAVASGAPRAGHAEPWLPCIGYYLPTTTSHACPPLACLPCS